MNQIIKKLFIGLIRLYQIGLSPLFYKTCRFYPTCSNYAIEAIEEYGILKGLWVSTIRILKCHPFHAGGYDPVTPHKCADRKNN
jgi:putative membrane protein insertion efficiency factor